MSNSFLSLWIKRRTAVLLTLWVCGFSSSSRNVDFGLSMNHVVLKSTFLPKRVRIKVRRRASARRRGEAYFPTDGHNSSNDPLCFLVFLYDSLVLAKRSLCGNRFPQLVRWVPTTYLRNSSVLYPLPVQSHNHSDRAESFRIYNSRRVGLRVAKPSSPDCFMTEDIYNSNVSPRLQAAVRKASNWSEFTYKDDPEFNGFCNAIRKEVERQQIERTGRSGIELDTVRMNKFYGVWYTASTFRSHWQHPTKRSENDILWILYNRGWSYEQGRVAMVAWWRVHRRKFDATTLKQLERLADRVWDEVQRKRMKKKIEAQQNSLRSRIVWFLSQQPATTAYLAEKLKATSKAVDAHLYRLRKRGVVERLSWGLYALRQGSGASVPKVHQVRPQEAPVQSVAQKEPVPPAPRKDIPSGANVSEADVQRIARRGQPFIPPAGCQCGGCRTNRACWKLEAQTA